MESLRNWTFWDAHPGRNQVSYHEQELANPPYM